MFIISSYSLVFLTIVSAQQPSPFTLSNDKVFSIYTSSLTVYVDGVVKFLNVRWEKQCLVNSDFMINHTYFPDESPVGHCPTFYELIPLPPLSVPNFILTGRCWKNCEGARCLERGPFFECKNRIETIPVIDFNPKTRTREIHPRRYPVLCYCSENKAQRLESVEAQLVN